MKTGVTLQNAPENKSTGGKPLQQEEAGQSTVRTKISMNSLMKNLTVDTPNKETTMMMKCTTEAVH